MTYKLLSNPTDNPKVKKNMGVGIYTAPLHLAPFNLSGYQVCPKASEGCAAACLHTAGNPAFMANKEKARIRKTKLLYEDRAEFFKLLEKDIEKLIKKTPKGFTTGIRLNATSDVPWEAYRSLSSGKNVFDHFPEVSFMDYTAIKKRADKDLPSNYHLTFSRKEDNDEACKYVLERGMNVAVVFAKDLPKTFWEHRVIDGDLHDWRPLDPEGVIVGLKAKGKARNDTSGFVIQEEVKQ